MQNDLQVTCKGCKAEIMIRFIISANSTKKFFPQNGSRLGKSPPLSFAPCPLCSAICCCFVDCCLANHSPPSCFSNHSMQGQNWGNGGGCQ